MAAAKVGNEEGSRVRKEVNWGGITTRRKQRWQHGLVQTKLSPVLTDGCST